MVLSDLSRQCAEEFTWCFLFRSLPQRFLSLLEYLKLECYFCLSYFIFHTIKHVRGMSIIRYTVYGIQSTVLV